MSAVTECGGSRWRAPVISQIFAWFAARGAGRRRLTVVDPAVLPNHVLRDIGLLDGRGPSLRRPER